MEVVRKYIDADRQEKSSKRVGMQESNICRRSVGLVFEKINGEIG